VCGGLATYLQVDPLFVRILFMLVAMANGTGLAVYVLMWLLVPSETSVGAQRDQVVRENVDEIKERARALGQSAQQSLGRQKWAAGWTQGPTSQRMLFIGAALVVVGLLVLLDNLNLLWWFRLGQLWPLILVGLGVVLLLNNLKGKH
jgi:phage shock protein PspC (stress-responsive transcriptional regulator)